MAKVTFQNGSSIELPDENNPEAGRALRPFEPHPCQEDELKAYFIAKARGASSRTFENFVLDYAFEVPEELKHGGSVNLVHSIIGELQERTSREFNDQLENYLKKNLASFGFEFQDQEEFYNFIKERVQRVEFQEDEEVQYFLDFKSEQNRGTLIGITHENRFRMNWEGNKLIGTIG